MLLKYSFLGYYKYCQCGCKELIKVITDNGKFRKFKKGHQNKGIFNGMFKGVVDISGYNYVYSPDHPLHDTRKYVPEQNLYYEQHYNCCLLPWIEIHHKDGNKKNNFDINNLLPITRSEHMRIHMKLINPVQYRTYNHIPKDRKCSNIKCKTPYFTGSDSRGYKIWYKDGKAGYLCSGCYKLNNYHKNKIKNKSV